MASTTNRLNRVAQGYWSPGRTLQKGRFCLLCLGAIAATVMYHDRLVSDSARVEGLWGTSIVRGRFSSSLQAWIMTVSSGGRAITNDP